MQVFVKTCFIGLASKSSKDDINQEALLCLYIFHKKPELAGSGFSIKHTEVRRVITLP